MTFAINWLTHSSEDFQFLLYFGLLFILLVVEQFFELRKVERGKRWKVNFTMTLIAIMTMTIIPFTFISAAAISAKNGWGLLNVIQINWIILGMATLLLRGFISFFTHYLMHKVPLLWRVHRVHHLDTEMDVSTTVRFHPFEFLINIVIGVPVVLLLGFPVWGLMLYELLDIVVTLVSHSNISFPDRIESILRYVLVTPDLHRVHHSAYQPETDSNFSAVFPVWDLLFGTFRTKTRSSQDEMQLGLEEVRDERTINAGWLLLSPFQSLKKSKTDDFQK